jgi:hypothetical protein
MTALFPNGVTVMVGRPGEVALNPPFRVGATKVAVGGNHRARARIRLLYFGMLYPL